VGMYVNMISMRRGGVWDEDAEGMGVSRGTGRDKD
jgi:hypothetical protein